MKAIRIRQFGDPNVLKLEDIPDPKPAAEQVLVDIKAIGVNPVDTYIRAGWYGPREFPYTPGMDAAGTVEAVGAGAGQFKPGDRVYIAGSITGAYAQKAVCQAFQVHPLPAHVSFAQGAAMGVPYATAYRALFIRGKALAGETVLVHGGSGGVGTAAIQIARAAGLTIFATAGTDRGRKLVAEQGAHHVLDHQSPDYLKQLMDLTGGAGVNLILEMLANVNLGKDLTILAKFGRVVVIGSRGPIEIDPRNTMGRDADIRGMTLMNADERQLKQIHAALVAGLENRTLRPIVGQELPLAQAVKSHEEVMKPGAYGKIVLIP
jgi:NADPH2:quinone reductase